ncbi:MAG: hypothetical protein ACK4NS_01190 [Saprospiraceae bacterium]
MGNNAIFVQPAKYNHKQRINKQIWAQVILGSPSEDCLGVGICRVLPNGARVEIFKCAAYRAIIGLTEENRCCIKFLKEGFDVKTIKRHFGWNLFQASESYALPANICRSLKVKSLILSAGVYPVFVSDKFLIVTLDVICDI